MIKNCNKNNIQNISKLILDAIEDIASTLTGEVEQEKILETLDSYIKMDICRLSHKNIFTYVKDEKIVGILVAYSSNDIDILDKPILLNLKDKGILKDSFEKECFEDEFYIDTISVLKKYQGQGIAKEFFNFAFKKAKELGYKKVSLLVDFKKEKAKNLYLKMGFEDNDKLVVAGNDFHHMIKWI